MAPRTLSDLIGKISSSQALAYFRRGSEAAGSALVRVVLASNVNNGLINGELEAASVNRERLGVYLLEPGDVVVAPARGAIRAAVVTEAHAGSLAGSNVLIVRSGDASPHYVVAVLNSERFNAQFTDGTGPLSVTELRSALIPHHTRAAQQEIAALQELATATLESSLAEYTAQAQIVNEFVTYEDGRPRD